MPSLITDTCRTRRAAIKQTFHDPLQAKGLCAGFTFEQFVKERTSTADKFLLDSNYPAKLNQEWRLWFIDGHIWKNMCKSSLIDVEVECCLLTPSTDQRECAEDAPPFPWLSLEPPDMHAEPTSSEYMQKWQQREQAKNNALVPPQPQPLHQPQPHQTIVSGHKTGSYPGTTASESGPLPMPPNLFSPLTHIQSQAPPRQEHLVHGTLPMSGMKAIYQGQQQQQQQQVVPQKTPNVQTMAVGASFEPPRQYGAPTFGTGQVVQTGQTVAALGGVRPQPLTTTVHKPADPVNPAMPYANRFQMNPDVAENLYNELLPRFPLPFACSHFEIPVPPELNIDEMITKDDGEIARWLNDRYVHLVYREQVRPDSNEKIGNKLFLSLSSDADPADPLARHHLINGWSAVMSWYFRGMFYIEDRTRPKPLTLLESLREYYRVGDNLMVYNEHEDEKAAEFIKTCEDITKYAMTRARQFSEEAKQQQKEDEQRKQQQEAA